MKGAYKINEIDLYTSFGWIAARERTTSNSFIRPNEDAPSFFYDFGDAKGVEWDLSTPLILKPRVFVLDGCIVGSSIADFWSKYNGFLALIRSGLLTIYVREINQYFSAVRKSYTKAERLTTIKNGQKIIAYLTIELNEVLASNFPDPELPEELPAFDSEISFANGKTITESGITITVAEVGSIFKFRFTKKTFTHGITQSMRIYYNGTEVMTVLYFYEYTGEVFQFIAEDGTIKKGHFINGIINI